MNSGKIVLGVLAGMAIGAIAGILFAPEKGSATRKKIAEKGEAYAAKLNTQFKGFVDDMTQRVEAMTEEAEAMAENGTAKITREMEHLKETNKA